MSAGLCKQNEASWADVQMWESKGKEEKVMSFPMQIIV